MTTAPNPFASEVPLTELPADQLRARVARARLYLIQLEASATRDPQSVPDLTRDHLAYIHKLDIEGRLFGYGSLAQDGGELAIVAAESQEQAERIASSEPLHRAGVRVNSVGVHTMNEGVACYVGRAMSRRVEAAGDPFDPDISKISLSYDELRARAVEADVHLIDLTPADKVRPPEDTTTMDAHFVWLRENEMAARLLSCGPVQAKAPLPGGAWGGGLGVVATSRDQAERIAAEEPSGRAGYRVLTVRPWHLRYGLAVPIARALLTLNQLPR